MRSIINPISPKDRAYRRRLAAEGQHQFIAALPRETVAFLDEFKEREGLRSRSQALLQLIEQGRQTAQQ
ncbi:MAG: ribbon-helix-helix protein, CopG family [Alphaproteobacteria bacterium]|nr:ribbon-helix-helix protein, CopG family [Alphaproteobacteria bacterium]